MLPHFSSFEKATLIFVVVVVVVVFKAELKVSVQFQFLGRILTCSCHPYFIVPPTGDPLNTAGGFLKQKNFFFWWKIFIRDKKERKRSIFSWEDIVLKNEKTEFPTFRDFFLKNFFEVKKKKPLIHINVFCRKALRTELIEISIRNGAFLSINLLLLICIKLKCFNKPSFWKLGR